MVTHSVWGGDHGSSILPIWTSFCPGGVMVATSNLKFDVERRGGSSPPWDTL